MAAFIVATTLYAVYHFHAGMLFWDEWDIVTRRELLSNIAKHHNEHRIVIPRLFFLVDKTLFAGSGAFNLASIMVIQALSAALLIIGMRETQPQWRDWWWIVGLVVGATFLGVQYENFLWGFQIPFVLVLLFAIAAFQLFSRGGNVVCSLFLPSLLGFMASITLASGILVLPTLVLVAILGRRPAWQVSWLGVMSVVIVALFLFGYRTPSHHVSVIDHLFSIPSVAVYTAAYIGSPLAAVLRAPGSVAVPLSVGLGLGGILLASWYAFQLWTRSTVSGRIPVWLLAILIFVGATAFMTGLGRLNFGFIQATSSRYATPALLFWVALLLLAWSARTVTLPRLGRSVPLFSMCLIALFAVWQPGLVAATEQWRDKLLWPKTALLAAAPDADSLKRLFHDPARILDRAPKVRAAGLSPYSEPWARWRGAPLTDHLGLAPSRRCLGAFDVVTSIPSDGATAAHAGWRVTGWAWDLLGGPIDNLVVANGAGAIVGYAITRSPRPDVRSLVPQVSALRTGWGGHAVAAASDTLQIYGVVDGGRLACPIGEKKSLAAAAP